MDKIMRISMAALIILALWSPRVLAEESPQWAVKFFPLKAGSTEERELTHDFGKIAYGSQVLYNFPMKNPYKVPLTITARTSCGCITAQPKPVTLGPNESGVLEVTLDGRRFLGPKFGTIYLTVAGGEYAATAELKVSAISRGDVVCNPSEANFGVVVQGQTPTKTIDIEYAGALDWQIKRVELNDAPVNVTYQQLYRQNASPTVLKVGYRLKVTLKTDAPAGDFRYEISLVTNDPATPRLPVVVAGIVQGTLTIAPSGPWNLSNSRVGDEVAKRVLIRGNKPFRILEINGLGNDITAELPKTSAPAHSVLFKCKPSKPGDIQRQLRIKTDLQDATVTLLVEGYVSPQ